MTQVSPFLFPSIERLRNGACWSLFIFFVRIQLVVKAKLVEPTFGVPVVFSGPFPEFFDGLLGHF